MKIPSIPTVHIGANKEDIAKTVIMPGDPLRAKMMAEKFLENYKEINSIRNMLGYTGEYKGKRITIIGSGMGCPSIGIYSYELFAGYDVDTIIRTGSAGGLHDDLNVGDVVIGIGASTDSGYINNYNFRGTFAPICDFELAMCAYNNAKKLNLNPVCGNIFTSDAFYKKDPNFKSACDELNILAVEMEAAALYYNAAITKKRALAIMTISDISSKNQYMSAEERQNSLLNMINLGLETAYEFTK